MDRRFFFQSLTAAGMLSPAATPAAAQEAASQPNAAGRKTRLYRMDYFYYRQGDQGTRINQFLASQMPLFTSHVRTLGVFTGVVTPLLQTTLVLTGFSSFEEMTAAGHAIEGDTGYQKAHEEFERGNEPPFDTAERQLLQATDFSPEIAAPAEKPKSPRYFELRIYHSPTQRQLRQVHERFAGPEIAIFHRSGVHPLFYADTIIGRELPNLTYLDPVCDAGGAREGVGYLRRRSRVAESARRFHRQGRADRELQQPLVVARDGVLANSVGL